MSPKSKLAIRCAVYIGLPTAVIIFLIAGMNDQILGDTLQILFGSVAQEPWKLGLLFASSEVGVGAILYLAYLIECNKGTPRNQGSSPKNSWAVLLTPTLICAFIYMTSYEAKGSQTITIEQQLPLPIEGIVVAHGEHVPLEIAVEQHPWLKEGVKQYERTGEKMIVINRLAYECCWQMILIIVVAGGILYVTYRIIKACRALKKKLEERNHDDDSTNVAKSGLSPRLFSDGNPTYAASIAVAGALMTAQDTNDCGCNPGIGFEYTAATTNVYLAAYEAKNMVDAETFLADYGLSTNALINPVSYSVNGQGAASLSQITFDPNTGVVSVNMSGFGEMVTNSFQSSPDMITWTNIPVRLAVPSGARVNGGFSPSGTQFFRLIK